MDNWIKFYNSPNEYVRMGRYFPHIFYNYAENKKIKPNYENINLGVVISTFGSFDYIKLHLINLKKNNISNILVVDDFSNEKDDLKKLCNEFNVDFICTPRKFPYKQCVGSNGDTAGFYYGLKWAKEKNVNLLVKFSRRLIPLFDWTKNLFKLAKESDAITFSSYCEKDLFNIRTECIGMYVPAWSESYILNSIANNLNNDIIVFAEYWFHEIAKILSYRNCSKKWYDFEKQQNLGYQRSGYALWLDILGTNRYNKNNRNEHVLWHMFNSEDEYLRILNNEKDII